MTEKEVTILSVKFDRMNEDIKEIMSMIKDIHEIHATKEELDGVSKRVVKLEESTTATWQKVSR